MAMTFTQIRETTFEELQPNAGVVLTEFEPDKFTGSLDKSKILFATSGGITFEDAPEFKDAGESIDNAPKNMKELKKFVQREVKVSGTAITFTPESIQMAMGSADVSDVTSSGGSGTVKKITPRDVLKDADFVDLWVVGDRGNAGGWFAVHLMNVLSSGGFKWKTEDQENGTADFEYMAHYSIADQDKVPYEAYIMTPAGE